MANLTAEDERLAGLISNNGSRIADLETAKTGFDTHFETVDGKIAALEKADQGFETRVGTLETNIGTPSGNFKTALFPAVETLQSRIDGLVAVGGEANLINGLTVNGTALVPNAEKIIDLPIFTGSTAGLVPIVGDGVEAKYVLTAGGLWANPFGDIGELTVKEYVDDAVANATLVWKEI